jgi:hypothetical protein
VRGWRAVARRKMLAANEQVANRVAELAKRRGTTVFQTVNDILEQAMRVEEMGLSLKEVVDKREALEKARRLGFAFTIERLLYEVVDLACNRDKDDVSEIWLDTGRWYGKYFASRSKDGVREFREALELLSFGTYEFDLKENRGGGAVSVDCVGEHFTGGYSELFSLFIEGVFDAFGYRPVNREVSKSIIRLRFEKPR